MLKIPSEKLDTQLIALDLDDTLLTKELKITPITVKALQDAAAKGIYIVPCSGRAENGILQFVTQTIYNGGLTVKKLDLGKWQITHTEQRNQHL